MTTAPQALTTQPQIRTARPDDVPAIVALIHELADYERAPELCHASDDLIAAALFGEHPALFAHVAENDGVVVGIAVWFLNFSTWEGVHGIYLEDLYVTPEHRGRGIGGALLARLAKVCSERGYSRLVWQVLDWNAPSIGFYESIGAVRQGEWLTYRLAGEPLVALGSGT